MSENIKTKTANANTCLFFRRIPREVRNKFHSACLAAGTTMTDVIIEVMKSLDTQEKVKEFMR